MNIRQSSVAATMFGLLALGTPVVAQTADSLHERCNTEAFSADVVIEACTALMQSGRLEGQTLLTAHQTRGLAYVYQEDNQRALIDYTEVIRLSPHEHEGYFLRALVYTSQGDNVRAVADYTKAIEEMSRMIQFVYLQRGEAYEALGDTAGLAANREAEQLIWTLRNQ